MDTMRTSLATLTSLLTVIVTSSCQSSERQTKHFAGPNGRVECLAPPTELVNKEVAAEADLLVYKIGKLADAAVRGHIDRERVRQELKPQVANWEVVDYRVCAL